MERAVKFFTFALALPYLRLSTNAATPCTRCWPSASISTETSARGYEELDLLEDGEVPTLSGKEKRLVTASMVQAGRGLDRRRLNELLHEGYDCDDASYDVGSNRRQAHRAPASHVASQRTAFRERRRRHRAAVLDGGPDQQGPLLGALRHRRAGARPREARLRPRLRPMPLQAQEDRRRRGHGHQRGHQSRHPVGDDLLATIL
jgi:hypothetical protein